ncbi:CehA/McbA family metallohydrolase [Portibacter marinus]|uniref:CehA/McbA family metallohydrolase n=1 Tax=Portibacter marinus TaxID=2898660 RepID=UPI001F23AF8D|nr:CehA/McbA family metallohydrolase [Portibacter marinus]
MVKPLSLSITSWIIILFSLPSLYGQNSELQLSILDLTTGLETPARVEIKDKANNFYIAEDALPAGGDCDMSDIGAQLTDLESALPLFNKEIFNPYFNSIQFYSDGSSFISELPDTIYLTIMKGSEYQIAMDTLFLKSGSVSNHTIRLERWVNMREDQWYSSDLHLHIPRPTEELNPYISKMMQAEDIHVGNLLQSGKVKNFKMAEQYAFGKRSVYEENGYLLAAGQENPRTHVFGHTITLGSEVPVFNEEKYLVYRLIWEQTTTHGGLNGFAHAWQDEPDGPSPQNGMALVLPHDLMHFIEVLQFNRAGYNAWYDVLNLGFEVAPTAGSDYPCADQSIPGHERFYTHVSGEFNYENWLESIELGKTFVTTGPVLQFTINDQQLGSKLELTNRDSITISGMVKFDPHADNIKFLEIVNNGQVIKKISRTDHSDSLVFKFKHHIEHTGWFALRGYGDKRFENVFNQPIHFNFLKASTNFHSAPIYVNVAGSKNPETKRVAHAYLARIHDIRNQLDLRNLEYLADQIMNPFDGVPREVLIKSRTSLLKELEHAEGYFEDLILGRE